MRLHPHLVLFTFSLLPILARGQQTTASPDIGSNLLQLGFGFITVLALLFVSLWLLKRLTAPRGQTTGLMRVVSSLAVGPRERVLLMEVGEQWLLIGVGPGHITKLGDLPRQALPPSSPEHGMPDFALWLKKALERRPETET